MFGLIGKRYVEKVMRELNQKVSDGWLIVASLKEECGEEHQIELAVSQVMAYQDAVNKLRELV